MPVHDWTRVADGIFHDFHHAWIEEMKRALNRGILPADYYAMAEQHAAGFGPDVLTLQGSRPIDDDETRTSPPVSGNGGVLVAASKLQPTDETDRSFYRRKRTTIGVRHVSGDRIIAMIEIVSPGNKAASNPLRPFVEKAAELLDKQIHLLILDVLPPGKRDPQGIHREIWQEYAGVETTAPKDKPLPLASYECGLSVRAYVVHAAVGDALTDMPLFLAFEKAVSVPLEATYQRAIAEVPQRWHRVLEKNS